MNEYIRHGSSSNIFQNVDELSITLGVLNNSDLSRFGRKLGRFTQEAAGHAFTLSSLKPCTFAGQQQLRSADGVFQRVSSLSKDSGHRRGFEWLFQHLYSSRL